jgi:hypothetical protein
MSGFRDLVEVFESELWVIDVSADFVRLNFDALDLLGDDWEPGEFVVTRALPK